MTNTPKANALAAARLEQERAHKGFAAELRIYSDEESRQIEDELLGGHTTAEREAFIRRWRTQLVREYRREKDLD